MNKNGWFFILLLLLTLFVSACSRKNSTQYPVDASYYAHLTTNNETSKIYKPEDAEIPRPYSVYYPQYKNESPISPVNACGSATFLYISDTHELHYAISYSGLSGSPIMIHIHFGKKGVNGPILQTIYGQSYPDTQNLGNSRAPPLLGIKAPNGTSGFITGVYKLEGNPQMNPPLSFHQELEALERGEIYLNIHTYLNQKGEIRGQIEPCKP